MLSRLPTDGTLHIARSDSLGETCIHWVKKPSIFPFPKKKTLGLITAYLCVSVNTRPDAQFSLP